MRILITGGAGYLGSVLCTKLLASGHLVRVLDNLMYGGSSLLSMAGDPRFELVKGDIRDDTTVNDALNGADAVVHLAAIVGDPACSRDPKTAVAVNHDASLRLVDAARAHEVKRFVFASTCSNYGRMADTAVLAEEDHELRPVSLYAETKVAMERHLIASNLNGMCPVVYRFATLYGLSPRMRFDLTVNQFVAEMLLEGKLTIFGEQFWRPYVHVRDAAQAIVESLQAPEQVIRGEVFNIGSTAENYRKSDIVALVQENLTRKADIEVVAQVDDPRDYRVSFEKVSRALGFVPSRTLVDGIREIMFAIECGIVDPSAKSVSNVR